jgi:hypothetical protein
MSDNPTSSGVLNAALEIASKKARDSRTTGHSHPHYVRSRPRAALLEGPPPQLDCREGDNVPPLSVPRIGRRLLIRYGALMEWLMSLKVARSRRKY